MDPPKSLRDSKIREARFAALEQPHVAPLTAFFRQLRSAMGADYLIPHFDPADGGTEASLLYLLEAPGPRAIASGFVSRDNPDETAKNFKLLNQEASWAPPPWARSDEGRLDGSTCRACDRQLRDSRTSRPSRRCQPHQRQAHQPDGGRLRDSECVRHPRQPVQTGIRGA
jgi:hypothetical protein